MYALNIGEKNRICSACVVLDGENYDGKTIVNTLPTGSTTQEKNIINWIYVDGEYIYDPLPEPEPPEPTPTDRERIAALEASMSALIGGINDVQ